MLRGRIYQSGKAVGTCETKKVKRYRSAFTTGQINYLEKQFKKCPYIGSATRKEVANLLCIQERAIKIWFQNRRMKEKKEVNNTEYNNTKCHNNLTIGTEFAKESLSNVHSSPTVNEHRCSLQSTTAKHVDKTNFLPYYDSPQFCNQSKFGDLKKETIGNHQPQTVNDGMPNNNINVKKEVKKTCLTESASFLKYNLNNNYNNKNFINYLKLNKKSATKSRIIPKTSSKSGSFRNSTVNVPSSLSQYQDLPEDLSARNLSNVIQQNYQGNIHLSPAYIPLCNTQDVCLAAGNVILNPLKIMSAVSPNQMPITAPQKQPSIIQTNVEKCKCNCNCHFTNGLNYDQANIIYQPKYVIAIPCNKNLNMLR